MNEAAITDWYTDPQNILDGFEFLQSWGHAFLCSIPIGTVLAIFCNYYREFHIKTQSHGVHLETQMTFFFSLLFLGLILGHDNRISGPHSNEFNPSAAALYDLLSILFYVILGFLIATLIISFVKFYKEEKNQMNNSQKGGKNHVI